MKQESKQLSPTKNNLVETIEKSIEPLSQLIKNKNISIYVESKNKVNAYYDNDRIVQVITNLISNAIKFCPEKDGIIIVQITDKEDFIQTSVFDNGKGINPKDFDAIFDKFYQSTNQNIKKPIGSGLGLAICKQIIENHKGKIWAQNIDKGACITIYFTKNKYIENI